MLRIRWIASLCAVASVLNSLPAIAQTITEPNTAQSLVGLNTQPSNQEPSNQEPSNQEPGNQVSSPTDVSNGLSQAESEPDESEKKPKRSYIGIGGNIGLSGDETAIGDTGFTIVTRTRIIDYLSLRGSVIFSGETTSATALTGEIPLTNRVGDIVAIPFLGGGISLADSDVNPLISTGVDVPLSKDFTVTNRVNVSFGSDETDVGLLIGVGYNYTLF